MAQFYDDLSNAVPSIPYPAFQARISRSGDTVAVQNDGTYGKYLAIAKGATAGSLAVAWGLLDGAQDVELLVRFRMTGSSPTSGRYGILYGRYDGNSEASTRGYAATFTPASSVPSIILNEDSFGTVNFANFSWSNNTMYWARMRINGNQQQFKIWPDGSNEPSSWLLDSTYSGPSIASPYSGIGNFTANSTMQVFYISAGTNGDTAPLAKKVHQTANATIVRPLYANGYEYRRKLTVNSSMVAGSDTNYVSLIDVTDSDLAIEGFGGKVHRNPLLDIRFEDLSGAKLPHEIQTYDDFNGRVVAWVNIPSLSTTTEIFMYYGKDLVPSDSDPVNWGSLNISGIMAGFGESDITAVRNSNSVAYNYNFGELESYTKVLKDAYGNSLTLNDNAGENSGQESGSAWYGYLMYHTSATAGRFSVTAATRANFKLVTYQSGQWKYDTNSALANFTPAAGDLLVARIKWGGSAGFECFQPFRAGEEDLVNLWLYSRWEAVWHLDDAPDGDANYFEQSDKGWYSHTGSSWGSMNAGDSVPGKIGNAVDLDGVNDYIVITSPGAADVTNSIAQRMAGRTDFGISGWFKTTSTTTNKLLLAVNTGTGGNVLLLWMTADGRVGIAGQGADQFSDISYNDGQWHMFHYSRAGSAQSMWIDGVEKVYRSGYNYTLSANDRWSFGQEWDTNTASDFFPGQIDEYRIGSRLAAATRLTDYQNQNNPTSFWSVSAEQVPYTIEHINRTANARIKRIDSLDQSANARIERAESIDQLANGYITRVDHIDQTANATILRIFSVDQTANATIERIEKITQTANATIESFYFTASVSQSANATIERIEHIDQPANAHIERVEQLQQTANAFIEQQHTIDQSADARIERIESISQLAAAYITRVDHIDQTANAMIEYQRFIEQPVNARIERIRQLQQLADAYIRRIDQLHQSADARIERTEAISITANARIRNPSPDKRPQQWEDASTEQPAEWQSEDRAEQVWDQTADKPETQWQNGDETQEQQWSDTDNKQPTEWRRQFYD